MLMDHTFISCIVRLTEHRHDAYTTGCTFQYVQCIDVSPLTKDGFVQIKTYTASGRRMGMFLHTWPYIGGQS